MFSLKLVEQPIFLETEKADSEINHLHYVSLKHLGTLDVYFGKDVENYRVLALGNNGQWSATRLEKNRLSANFQGSPLWPKQALSDYNHLSQFFALDQHCSDNLCVIPLTNTLNDLIRSLLLEAKVPERKIYTFQDSIRYEGKKYVGDKLYVDTFIDERKLPMAPVTERDSIHDWSYHFLTMLFTDYLENIRLNLKAIRSSLAGISGTTNYSWNYYGHTMDSQGNMNGTSKVEELSHQDALYRQMAISLDTSTAKIVQLLSIQKKGLIDKCKTELEPLRDYLKGVCPEALQRILWQDPKLCNSVELGHDKGISITIPPLDYVAATLNDLDTASMALRDQGRIDYRKKVFTITSLSASKSTNRKITL